ncbi:MAG TPA: J domain-containing protein [Candidatus Dormibacteraeota bacterium]|nr:J domain-containing protein [Candidatus Dormibacteraeota bacterium]
MKSRRRQVLDVYAVLGAERSATWSELRRTYRARARELHPDVQVHRPTPARLDQPRATALFTQLQEAWSMVATPERRAAYDLSLRGRVEEAPPHRVRPTSAPRWSSGPRAGVLLRTGPGDLHIAIPGGAWDLSLAQFLQRAHAAGHPPLLIGDLPPHPALRDALRATDFVERHRLTTMVGLNEPLEDRGGPETELDDDGVWKIAQLDRTFIRWSRALPARRAELPYADDLRVMGQLSLAGYEINLPHPAGLYAALEPRPADRQEAKLRTAQVVLDVRLPPAPLALVARWADDERAMAALRAGWEGLAQLAYLDGPGLVAAQRALEGRRMRRDGHDPLPGSALDGGPPPPSLLPILQALPMSRHWLEQRLGPLPALPWGDPLSQSGDDRSLGDASTRLLGRVLGRLLLSPPHGLRLVALRGSRVRFRVEDDPEPAAEWIDSVVAAAFQEHMGFPARPSVAKV